MADVNVEALRAEYCAIESQLTLLPKTTRKGKNDPVRGELSRRKHEIQTLLTTYPKPARSRMNIVNCQLKVNDALLQQILEYNKAREELVILRSAVNNVLLANLARFQTHEADCMCEFCTLVRIVRLQTQKGDSADG